MTTNTAENTQPTKTRHNILSAVGIALCIIFGLLLICNITIIAKGTIAPERPPSIFGITPMVVLSGSMSGDAVDHIEAGDLIFASKADPEELKVGDIISFMEGGSTSVTTHRIIDIVTTEGGKRAFVTKGDANNTQDEGYVSEEQIVGIYQFRIPKIGDFALFLQQPLGMLLFIGVPVLSFIIYDIIRRQRAANKESQKNIELEAELERLRKLTGEQPADPTSESES